MIKFEIKEISRRETYNLFNCIKFISFSINKHNYYFNSHKAIKLVKREVIKAIKIGM